MGTRDLWGRAATAARLTRSRRWGRELGGGLVLIFIYFSIVRSWLGCLWNSSGNSSTRKVQANRANRSLLNSRINDKWFLNENAAPRWRGVSRHDTILFESQQSGRGPTVALVALRPLPQKTQYSTFNTATPNWNYQAHHSPKKKTHTSLPQ